MPKTKGLFISLCLFIFLSVGVFAAAPKHKITFNIKGLQNTQVYMGCHYGDKDYIQDTAKVDAKGNFEFSGAEELPGGVYFVLLKSRKYFEIVIDHEQKFSMACDTTDFIVSMKVIGSPENSAFYQYLRYVTGRHAEVEKYEKEQNRTKIDTVNAEVKRYKVGFEHSHSDFLLSKVFAAAEEPVIPPSPKLPNGKIDSTFPYRYYKAHFFDNIDFSEGRLVRSPVIFPRIKEYLTRLTVQDPDSIIAAADYLVGKAKGNPDMFKFIVAYITSTYEGSNIMGMDAVFVHMAKKYYSLQQTPWVSASQLEKIIERATQLDPILIGKRCPRVVLPDTANVMRALDSVHARYTVLYFWDYDCGYCQKVTPKLIKWYDSIKGEGIEVYAVELNETEIAKWKDYIKKNRLDWINVSDIFHTSNVHQQFDINATPIIYVLDENKNIIAKKIEIEELNRVLRNDMEKHNHK
jgi:thiol-disulfide isomerase/thioredoxin